MNAQKSNMKLVSKLLFRLLPVQFFLALVSSVNSIVSGLFATNCINAEAMTAIGLYNPINMLLGAISIMLVGGATILCGEYIGRNEQKKVQNVFSLDIMISVLIAALFVVFFVLLCKFHLTGFMADDLEVKLLFEDYLLGQAIGLVPLLLGNQLASFLSLQNQMKRTTIASIAYIAVNVGLNYLFVVRMQMGAFGLALASSIGLWVFLLIQAVYFFKPSSSIRLFAKPASWGESLKILKIGFPGAATFGYQTVRGFIVNKLLQATAVTALEVSMFNLALEPEFGSMRVSAFTAADTLLRIGWALPTGMLAVSRMMISISVGEEDRQTLVDVMRNMFYRFLPLMSAICALVIIFARPLAMLYYSDTSAPVFMMTVWGFRILPLCMPLSIICMHFTCYGQASDKQVLVHLLSLLDGVICVAGFTALLIRSIGMNSIYIANVLNGVVTTITIWAYSIIKKKKFPKNVEELMVIPDDFGVSEDERMDLSVKSTEAVVTVAHEVQDFCHSRGIDSKRAYLAGLFLEEMAGNVVDHGFSKDKKEHSVDVRVVHKDNDVILRIKDDCVPFDPAERAKIMDPADITKNIGIRMVYKMTDRISYQNILGLNVLTITI